MPAISAEADFKADALEPLLADEIGDSIAGQAADAIRVSGLWKRYGLPFGLSPLYWLKRGINQARGIRPGLGDGPFAIRDLSFSVRRGETLGIMGRNGSGKSTLLKVLSGVSPPTAGSVAVEGRLFPMIELNAGLNPELNGQENARTLAAVMGFDQATIEAKLPEIEDFCELGEWFYRPVRTYSSGMMARLGFGVAMHVEADVLLIDEVLAVGDFAFQKKCLKAFTRLQNAGVTTVFVSHNPYMIERMCDHVIVMHEGRQVAAGKAEDAVAEYFRLTTPPKSTVSTTTDIGEEIDRRAGTGDLRVTKLEMLDADERPLTQISSMQPLTIRLSCNARESIEEPNFGIRFLDENNTVVLSVAFTNHRRGVTIAGKAVVDCNIERMPLLPGRYTIQVKVTSDILLDMLETASTIDVMANDKIAIESAGLGFVYAPASWRIDGRQLEPWH